MKEKWIPHIIAVMCLVFFMVLGLGSGTVEGSVQKDNSLTVCYYVFELCTVDAQEKR